MELPLKEMQEAFDAKDPVRIAAFYAEDALFFTPARPPAHGREAIHGMMAEDVKDPGFRLDLTPHATSVSASGDLGYVRGTLCLSFTNPGTGQVQTIGANYLQVFLKSADGFWKVVEDISSPAAPPAS